jgi:hypothetical protein
MKYTQKSGYTGIRSYLTSIVGSAAVGAAVLFGGLEARAQDPLKFLTKTVLIDKSPLPKDQKDLLHIDNMLDVQREGTAKYEAEQKHKESVENQEKIIKLLEEKKAQNGGNNQVTPNYNSSPAAVTQPQSVTGSWWGSPMQMRRVENIKKAMQKTDKLRMGNGTGMGEADNILSTNDFMNGAGIYNADYIVNKGSEDEFDYQISYNENYFRTIMDNKTNDFERIVKEFQEYSPNWGKGPESKEFKMLKKVMEEKGRKLERPKRKFLGIF